MLKTPKNQAFSNFSEKKLMIFPQTGISQIFQIFDFFQEKTYFFGEKIHGQRRALLLVQYISGIEVSTFQYSCLMLLP